MKKNIAISFIVIIVGIVIALFTLTAPLVQTVFNQTYEKQNIEMGQDLELEVNPFDSIVTISHLDITDFAHDKTNGTPIVNIKNIRLEYDLASLFSNKIEIKSLRINGLNVSVKQFLSDTKSELYLGDTLLDRLTSITGSEAKTDISLDEVTEPSVEQRETQLEEKTFQPFRLNLDLFEMTNSQIVFLQDNHVESSLAMQNTNKEPDTNSDPNIKPNTKKSADVSASELVQTSSASTNVNSLKITNLKLVQPKHNALEIAFAITINNKLRLENWSDLSYFETTASVIFPIDVTHDSNTESTQINIPDMNISLNEIALSSKNNDIAVTLQQLALKSQDIEFISTVTEEDQIIDLSLSNSTNLNQLLVKDIGGNVEFLALEKINIDNNKVKLRKASEQLELTATGQQLVLNDLKAMSNRNNTLPKLAELDLLTVNNWSLRQDGQNQNHFTIDDISVGNVIANIRVNKTKDIENLYLPKTASLVPAINEPEPSEPKSNKSTTAASDQPSTSRMLKWALTKFENSGTWQINTIDKSVEPNFNSKLSINKFLLSDLDQINSNYVTTLTVDAKNNDYGSIKVDARSQLFVPQPWHDFEINIDEFDLVGVSPYISGALGYHITNGQLDSEIKGKIRNNKIDGSTQLLLRSIDLNAMSNKGEAEAFSSGAISFNYALSMLKDSDGNVELDVPFKGDLANPSVGFSGFLSLIVKRATMSAAKDYLINTFVPYANVVNFALSAGQEALKMRVKNLNFGVKQQDLDENHQDKLLKLADVLTKYPGVSLKLCPISVDTDVGEQTLEQTGVETKNEKVQLLRNLAQLRVDRVKSFLVNKGKIASKRLLACSPAVDYSKDAKPRIEFSQL